MEIAENSAKAGTLTEQAAKKLIADLVERTSGEALHSHTVAEWLAEWQGGKADSKAKTTADRYKQAGKEFVESLGNRSKLSLAHIIPKDIRAFRDAELAAGKSPTTTNDSVRIISTAFNAALRQGYITNNPCTALESLPEETAERETFTVGQVAELVGKAEGDWKGAILFAYYTGARLGDVANMPWSAIDLEKRLITFSPGKTKRTKRRS